MQLLNKQLQKSKCAIHWGPDHRVLPPVSWLNGGLNMKTKSSTGPVLSSSHYSKPDTGNLSSLKQRESAQLLLKLTLLNSLYGVCDRTEGPSRLSTKSRNFTSTIPSFVESDCLFISVHYSYSYFSFSVSACLVFCKTLLSDLCKGPHEEV